jgi:hypothetical protein
MATATYPSTAYGPSFPGPVGSHYAPAPPSTAWYANSRRYPTSTFQSNSSYAPAAPLYEMSGAIQDPSYSDQPSGPSSRPVRTSTIPTQWRPAVDRFASAWRSSGASPSDRPTIAPQWGRQTTITPEDFLPPSEEFELTARDLEQICAGDTRLTGAERAQLTGIALRHSSYRSQANQWIQRAAADWLDSRQEEPGWTNGVRNALSVVDKGRRDVHSVARDFDVWYESKVKAGFRGMSTQSSSAPRMDSGYASSSNGLQGRW